MAIPNIMVIKLQNVDMFVKCYTIHVPVVVCSRPPRGKSSSQDALDMGSARYIVLPSNFIFNSLNVGIGFKKPFYFLKFMKLLFLFHELMNQNQACLYFNI